MRGRYHDALDQSATARLVELLRPVIDVFGPSAVARSAGIMPRTIYRWTSGEGVQRSGRMSFQVADNLVTRVLGGPTLWHTDPVLAAWYGR